MPRWPSARPIDTGRRAREGPGCARAGEGTQTNRATRNRCGGPRERRHVFEGSVSDGSANCFRSAILCRASNTEGALFFARGGGGGGHVRPRKRGGCMYRWPRTGRAFPHRGGGYPGSPSARRTGRRPRRPGTSCYTRRLPGGELPTCASPFRGWRLLERRSGPGFRRRRLIKQ